MASFEAEVTDDRTEAGARKRREQGHAAAAEWFRGAVAQEDREHDAEFDRARDHAVKLREEAQAAHSRAAQAQAQADTLRRRPRPDHAGLIAERDKRLQRVDDDFNGEMAGLLGDRGFSTGHWTRH